MCHQRKFLLIVVTHCHQQSRKQLLPNYYRCEVNFFRLPEFQPIRHVSLRRRFHGECLEQIFIFFFLSIWALTL